MERQGFVRSRCPCGPRRLDTHQRQRVKPSTILRYRRAAASFVDFLDTNHYQPQDAEEFDDVMVEYKNRSLCSKADFEATVSSVEFMFPRFKGKLLWSRMVLNGWNVVHQPRHTVPLAESQAFLVAVHFCAARYPRLAVGLLTQQKLGLRPSEMLALTTSSFSMPEHRADQAGTEEVCV